MSSGELPDRQSNPGISKSFSALTVGAFPVPAEHDSTPWVSPPNSPLPERTQRESLTSNNAAQSLIQSTSFTLEVVENLRLTHPEVLTWLRSTSGVLFQGALIFTYILSETLCSLLTSFALKPDPPPEFKPLPSSIVVMSSSVSIVLSLLVTTGTSIFCERVPVSQAVCKTFKTTFQWRSVLSYSLIAVLFSVAKIFKMMAYSKVNAGLIVVLDQLRVLFIAAMSTVVVGKKYSMQEWLSLLIVLLAVCSFFFAETEHDEVTEMHTRCRHPASCFTEPSYDLCGIRVDGSTIIGTAINDRRDGNITKHEIHVFEVKAAKSEWTGLMFRLMSMCFACLGSLFSEKLMKSSASTPFPVQNCQMETTALPVAVAMAFAVPLWIDRDDGKAVWWRQTEAQGSGEGFFQGYNSLTLVAIAMDVILSWMGGIIIKQLSSLVKGIAKNSAMLLTVFCAGTIFKACHADPLPMTMYSLAFIAASGTVLFGTQAVHAPPSPVAPAHQAAVSSQRSADSSIQLLDKGATLS